MKDKAEADLADLCGNIVKYGVVLILMTTILLLFIYVLIPAMWSGEAAICEEICEDNELEYKHVDSSACWCKIPNSNEMKIYDYEVLNDD